jgi:hypothetical protein
MSCKAYQKFEMGEWDEEKFTNHLKSCPICQKIIEQDKRLMELAASLNQPVITKDLWPTIEADLKLKQQESKRYRFERLIKNNSQFLRIAAILLLGSALVFYLFIPTNTKQSGVLSQTALEKVKEKEEDYIKAIDELQVNANAHLSEFDIELVLFYRDKIETIDAQIDRCKEALETNPANTHIRRYMLAALIDKKETLLEILEYQPQGSEF